MAARTDTQIAKLLEPYLGSLVPPKNLYLQLGIYLDLLLRWNAQINLTAIREPDEIVLRHFGESLFLGTCLNACCTLLDYGSGAGFPGIPIQLLKPDLHITLAESQGKKAAFLREAVRVLGLQTEVWDRRVEAMPPDRLFDVVALRAVDNMDLSTELARTRVSIGGTLALMIGGPANGIAVPNSDNRFLLLDRC